jgi:hypothetical protein
MKGSACILYAVFCAAAFRPADAGAQQQSPATPRFERGDSVDVRGVEIFDRIVYFPASINGFGPYPFVLDTGAGEEVVQFGLADTGFAGIAARDVVIRLKKMI